MTEPRVRERMTVSDLATIYGCCGLFDLCGSADLMSLSFEGTNKFLDWIGWQATNECNIIRNFITWIRPEANVSGTRSAGYIADPCGESNGVEWGTCDFTLHDFGLLRRHGPVRNVTRTNLKYCETQPRYRLDGTLITSDVEYDMRVTTEGMLQDLKLMLINGNGGTPGQFSGLQSLIKTGYLNSDGHHCKSMDSMIIDFNGNGMQGGHGITWNGAVLPAHEYSMVDILLAVLRRIRDRIDMAPQLAAQSMNVGDIVIVATPSMIRCILDAYTCWSVCPGLFYEEGGNFTMLNTYEARTFRNGLNGGMFGNGKIFLDQMEIPLVAYNWGLQKGPTLADMYVLTGQVGAVKTISGQFNDLAPVPGLYPDGGYSVTDGGRLMTWFNRDQTCGQREVEMQPRLLLWAPWAQARFQDVRCTSPAGPLSPDPWETSFFPETSFIPAECPHPEPGIPN